MPMSKVKMHMALKAAITKDEQGYVVFPYPDFEIDLAKELGVSKWVVQEYRRKTFGKIQEKLSGPPSRKPSDDLSEYVIDLIGRVEMLEKVVADMQLQDFGLNIDPKS